MIFWLHGFLNAAPRHRAVVPVQQQRSTAILHGSEFAGDKTLFGKTKAGPINRHTQAFKGGILSQMFMQMMFAKNAKSLTKVDKSFVFVHN